MAKISSPRTSAFATYFPILWCKNIGETYLAAIPVFHSRMKHVKIHYHFVRELVNSKQLRIGYVSTKDQLADLSTKALPKQRFLHLKSKLHVLPTVSLREGIDAFQCAYQRSVDAFQCVDASSPRQVVAQPHWKWMRPSKVNPQALNLN